MSKYDDIIFLPHPVSKKHPQMSLNDRAAQFAPFAALTGYGDIIEETGRVVDRRIELDEDEKEKIDRKLMELNANKEQLFELTYFVKDRKKEGGRYESVTACLFKIDYDKQTIILDDKSKIRIEDILKLEYL